MNTMNNDQIKKLALKNGFKLKQQPNGEEDLNPYVYDFARALLSQASEGQQQAQRESFASLAPNAAYIKSSSYQDLFCGQGNPYEWVNFEWSEAHQRNRISVYREGKFFYINLIDSFRFYDDEKSGQCTLVLNENTECLIVYNIPLDQKAELIEMMTHSPLLTIRHVKINQVIEK